MHLFLIKDFFEMFSLLYDSIPFYKSKNFSSKISYCNDSKVKMQKTRKYKCVKIDLVVEKKSVRYKSRGCIMLSKLFTTVVT